MKVCSKKTIIDSQTKPQPILGHVYRLKAGHCHRPLLLACKVPSGQTLLVVLENGNRWSGDYGFGNNFGPEHYEDVTDQVCIDTSNLKD